MYVLDMETEGRIICSKSESCSSRFCSSGLIFVPQLTDVRLIHKSQRPQIFRDLSRERNKA